VTEPDRGTVWLETRYIRVAGNPLEAPCGWEPVRGTVWLPESHSAGRLEWSLQDDQAKRSCKLEARLQEGSPAFAETKMSSLRTIREVSDV
jgi:hypothetical protein